MAKRSLVPETGGLRVVAIRWAGGGLVIETLDGEIAREHALPFERDGVAISREGLMRGEDAELARPILELVQKEAAPLGSFAI